MIFQSRNPAYSKRFFQTDFLKDKVCERIFRRLRN